MVTDDLAAVMNQSAAAFPPEMSEVDVLGLATLPSTKVAPPRLADSPVNIECRVLFALDLGEDPVQSTLFVGQIVMWHIRSDLVDDELTASTEGLRVDVTSVDAFLAEHPALELTAVKIDVEGHEAAVLLGMRRTLAQQRPIVIVELHGTDRDVLAILGAAGYVPSVLERGPQRAVLRPGSHLLAVPA